MSILLVKNLTVKYNNYNAIQNVSFSIEKGDYLAITGPNGAGKTTLIKAILGLINISHGEISISTNKFGYLPQKINLDYKYFPANVFEVVSSGLLLNDKSFYLKKEMKEKVYSILNDIGILNLKNKLIGNLSGGQFQKVLLARALVAESEILFLDEPATALDPLSREKFYELLKKLNSEKNITIIMVSHDIGSIGKYAKRMIYIDRKLIFNGTFKEFCESKSMTDYFGLLTQHFICQRHN